MRLLTDAGSVIRWLRNFANNALTGREEIAVLKITVGDLTFEADLEEADAPHTVEGILKLLPISGTLLQAPWCGEAGSLDMSDSGFDLGESEHESFENHTTHPSPGNILIYPGGFSDPEILFAYGPAIFARRFGNLAGNHFATVTKGREHFKELGRRLQYEGAQAITIEKL